jgi:hypothetical protein
LSRRAESFEISSFAGNSSSDSSTRRNLKITKFKTLLGFVRFLVIGVMMCFLLAACSLDDTGTHIMAPDIQTDSESEADTLSSNSSGDPGDSPTRVADSKEDRN